MPPGGFGYNTGVWLMDAEAMRASEWYAWILEAYQRGHLFRHLGMVPDQNFINGVVGLSPGLVHTLSCGWNRQLMSWTFGAGGFTLKANEFHRTPVVARVVSCDAPCGLLHFNGPLKCPVRILLDANASCGAWHSMIDAIPNTSDAQLRADAYSGACLLRRNFGGLSDHGGRGDRARIAVHKYWGGCCRA